MRLKALHKKNLVKAKKIIVDSITDQLVPQVSSLKTPEMFDSLTEIFEGKNINQNMTLKNVKIQNTVILYEGLSNQRTTCSSRRRSGECRSGENHLEWPPMIMGFIHSRKVCQKEVITFSRLWEEEEARLIIREEKMGASEDQALTIQRRSLKQ